MDRINLIPDDLVLTWQDRLLAFVDRRFWLVLIWVIGLVGLLQSGLAVKDNLQLRRSSQHAATLQGRQVTLKAELESNQAYLTQLEQAEGQLNTQLQRLMQQIAHLSSYRERQGELAATLHEIKRAIPYGIWLTELESTAGNQLRIAGGAFEDHLVTQFMARLKDNPRFTNVAFSFTRKAKIGKTGIVAFEVTCQMLSEGRAS